MVGVSHVEKLCCWKRDDLRESEGGGYHVRVAREGGREKEKGSREEA